MNPARKRYSIRKSSAAELAAVKRLHRRIVPHDKLRLDGREWWLAWRGTIAVGFAGMLIGDGCAYLSLAGVLGAHRRHGLHKRLIRARVSHARRLGLASVVTYTLSDNVQSANSLTASGFRLWLPTGDAAYVGNHKDVLYFRLEL